MVFVDTIYCIFVSTQRMYFLLLICIPVYLLLNWYGFGSLVYIKIKIVTVFVIMDKTFMVCLHYTHIWLVDHVKGGWYHFHHGCKHSARQKSPCNGSGINRECCKLLHGWGGLCFLKISFILFSFFDPQTW